MRTMTPPTWVSVLSWMMRLCARKLQKTSVNKVSGFYNLNDRTKLAAEEVETSKDRGQLQALSPEQFAAFAEEFVTSNEEDIDTLHDDHSVTEEASERNNNLSDRGRVHKHQRFESLRVNFSHEEVRRIAQEIYDKTVAEVNLSLFSYWINESSKNYEEASLHIRELRLDHVSIKSSPIPSIFH